MSTGDQPESLALNPYSSESSAIGSAAAGAAGAPAGIWRSTWRAAMKGTRIAGFVGGASRFCSSSRDSRLRRSRWDRAEVGYRPSSCSVASAFFLHDCVWSDHRRCAGTDSGLDPSGDGPTIGSAIASRGDRCDPASQGKMEGCDTTMGLDHECSDSVSDSDRYGCWL